MPFSASWHTLLDELDDLPEGATLITPLSHDRFRVSDVQEQRVVIEFLDRDKVDDALDVTELSESDVYDIEESEYVRKVEVDEERKETRLQGLKDQLAAAEGDEAEELREEIEELEGRIEELTEFKSGSQFHTRAGGEP